MKMFAGFFILIALIIITACATTQKIDTSTPIGKALQAHGGKHYQNAAYAFTFRKRAYTFKNDGGNFDYTAKYRKEGKQYADRLNNAGFTRHIDGKKQALSDKDATRFGNSLNSVIYFAQLPYKLEDPAVQKIDKGSIAIKGKKYEVVEVRFTEEGGGTDHDDVFYYWINQDTHLIDYLAYRFHVDKGGIRFRSAYNTRKIDGIYFQDYVNYKADLGTPMEDLPRLFEEDKLKELSKIELENVRMLK